MMRCRTFRFCQRPGGFTLVEVLAATVIFGFVLIGLYSTWTLVVRGNQSALKMTEEGQRARMAIRTLEDALISTVLFTRNITNYAFLTDTSDAYARISLVGHLPESFPGSGYFGGERIRRVTIAVEPGANGRNELIMRQNSITAADLESGGGIYPLILARDCTGFQLEFSDPRKPEWINEWIYTNQLPTLVRVTLALGQSARNRNEPEQLVVRVVRLPSSGVPPDAQGGLGTQ